MEFTTAISGAQDKQAEAEVSALLWLFSSLPILGSTRFAHSGMYAKLGQHETHQDKPQNNQQYYDEETPSAHPAIPLLSA
jgi:hypothetical protein